MAFGGVQWFLYDSSYLGISIHDRYNNNNTNILYLDTLSREETLFKGVMLRRTHKGMYRYVKTEEMINW